MRLSQETNTQMYRPCMMSVNSRERVDPGTGTGLRNPGKVLSGYYGGRHEERSMGDYILYHSDSVELGMYV